MQALPNSRVAFVFVCVETPFASRHTLFPADRSESLKIPR